MEMLDASGYLWRLYLDGIDDGCRWAPLSDAWTPSVSKPYYAFNDAFAVMAYVAAGKISEADDLVSKRRRWLSEVSGDVTNATMTAEIGIPVCEAVIAFGRGNHDVVLSTLMPIRDRLGDFGGSHAQRDAFQRTLVESAIRSGQRDLALKLMSERVSTRPASRWNVRQSARAAQLEVAESAG
jgi:hypothetical protein